MYYSIWEIIGMTIIGYLCVWSIIDRICKCIEHCKTAKSFNTYVENVETITEVVEDENA